MEQRTAYWQTKAHRRLLELSENPVDLRPEGIFEGGDRLQYVCHSDRFALHYWTQRVNSEVLDALQLLADQCDLVGQFKAMKQGAVMNTIAGVESEHRQVLHTACRDLFHDTPCEPAASGLCRVELEKLKAFLVELSQGKICSQSGETFTTLIHIGIGGSDLGPRSVYEALKPFGGNGRKVYFISNVDPDDAASVLRQVDLSRCLVNIVSKSGTTLETITNERLVRHAFLDMGLDPTRHCIAVTGKDSPMDDPEKYLRSFYMFDFIGGRYSTSSMVGLTMLGFFLGYEQLIEFLKGASAVDYEAEEKDIRKNIPLLLAVLGVWNHTYLKMPTLAVLPYSQALHRFPAHLQQCDMESNGKSVSRKGVPIEHQSGPVVWGEPGTNGQHAFYQLLHQGTETVPIEFIGFRNSQYLQDITVEGTTSQRKLIANMLAQAVAFACGKHDKNPNRHFPGNRPSSMLIADRLDPETMGALLALYEAKIVFQGFAWDINSFDQEGVQLGKVLANQFLEEMNTVRSSRKCLQREILEITGIV